MGRAGCAAGGTLHRHQIGINRPGHKYRLTVEGRDPQGRKSAFQRAGGPSRPWLQPRRPLPAPWATPFSSISAAARTFVALLAHLDGKLDFGRYQLSGAPRLYGAGGKRVSFNEMNRLTRHRCREGRADSGAGELRRSGQSGLRGGWFCPMICQAALGKRLSPRGD